MKNLLSVCKICIILLVILLWMFHVPYFKMTAWAYEIFAVENSSGNLLQIDPLTAQFSLIGPSDFIGLNGLAFDYESQSLFSVDQLTGQLIQIDVSTGKGAAIGQVGLNRPSTAPNYLGHTLTDLTYGGDGTLYGLTNGESSTSRLITIDTATGEGYLVKLLNAGQLSGLAYQPNLGKMYATSQFGFGWILQIDLSTWEVNSLNNIGPGLRLLTDDPNSNNLFGVRYYGQSYDLEIIDTSVAYPTQEIGSIYNPMLGTLPISGIEAVDIRPIPVPTTLLLLGSGLMGLAQFRRKFRR